MMSSKIASVFSSSLDGLIAKIVQVEVNIRRGIPRFNVVGLAAASIKEATDRVRVAIENSGYEFPLQNILVNLSPAGSKKDGSWFDLPIALGILKSSEQIYFDYPTEDFLVLGELGLDGSVRPLRGIINILLSLKQSNFKFAIVPEGNRLEASLIPYLDIYSISHLSEIETILRKEKNKEPTRTRKISKGVSLQSIQIFDTQKKALRAIQICLAGDHHLLMIGSPGSGKSMLAKLARLIAPPLTDEEYLEVLRIKSTNELILNENFLQMKRPYRSPHHTASDISIVGGGRDLKMGEVTLAHGGILFLDELGEFKPHVIQALREPMEEGKIIISRVTGHITYPSSFVLIGATNPCPCGYYFSEKNKCICSQNKIRNYFSKFSGPFLDRIDLEVELYQSKNKNGFSVVHLSEISEEIQKAREIQYSRYSTLKTGFNGKAKPLEIEKLFLFDESAGKLLKNFYENPGQSVRKLNNVKKVSRTIADLCNSLTVTEEHVYEALTFQCFSKYFYFLNDKAA